MNIVISAGGRFHALQLAHQLEKRNQLSHLFTFSYTNNDQQIIPTSHASNITICSVLDTIFLKARLDRIFNKSSYNIFKDNLFDHIVSKKISSIGKFDLFVGWAHYALHSIPAARKAGAKVVIESGSCHILEQQQLLEQEYTQYEVPFAPLHQKNIEKMLKEYELTDYIMTLSTFAYNSFLKWGIPEHKLLKVTCGMDVEYFMQPHVNQKKFRVIFVGLLNLRKGIHYLLQAWNKLNLPEDETELLLVGNLQQDLKLVLQKIPIKKNVVFYGSTNREKLRELYASSTIFVLPSVEDGFGMVMGEAMASGLPVICTTNTGGPDIITDREHGFIIPAQNVDVLAEKIAWCYNNQKACSLMGMAAQKHIKKFTWDVYGKKVYEIYQKIL